MIERKFGWRKQVHDPRDFKLKHLGSVRPLATVLPPAVNLRKWCSYIEDQGSLGSCTANAWAGLLEFNENKYPVSGRKYFDMSRLFIYYNERVIEGTVNEDSGAQLRDGAKAIANYGSCAETYCPYIINEFTVKPSDTAYTNALPYRIHSYYSLDGTTPSQTLQNLKTCIASGEPFVFGFEVYESFMTEQMAKTGIMPVPNTRTEQLLGGHAVMAIGYDDTVQRFLVRNSWGKHWGLPSSLYRGYFTMPYQIWLNGMASDAWTVVKEI